MKKYQIIYADPPWQFKNYNDKKAVKWSGKHYSLMTTQEICNLPVNKIADKDCALFIWITYPKLLSVFKVIEAWGFKYKTVAFTWIKKNKKGKGFWLGLGYWTRSNAEICLLATKGHPKRINKSIRQVIISRRREHSRKPDGVRRRIIKLLGNLSCIELFAREKAKGWDVWGNEVKSDIKL